MAIDYGALNAEVMQDPEGLGYLPFLPDSPGSIVALLNKQSTTRTNGVSHGDILAWAGANAVLVPIQQAAATGGASDPLRNAAQAFVTFVQSGTSAMLQFSAPAVQGMLSALIAAGILTTAQVDSLMALAQVPASRAEVLFGAGAYVTEADIQAAIKE